MITHHKANDESLTLTRAVSGHGYQHVTATRDQDGVLLRVATRLQTRHGDGWAEAVLHDDDLTALRDWLNSQLGC